MKVLRSIRDSITVAPEPPARVLEPNDPRRNLPSRDAARTKRRRDVRARTVSVKRMTKRELEMGRLLYPPVDDVVYPETRGDCEHDARPCPFVRCRYHLYLDVDPIRGAIKFNFPDLEVDELGVSCVLGVADHQGTTVELVAAFLNMTRERVRQIEVKAFDKLAAAAPELAALLERDERPSKRRLPVVYGQQRDLPTAAGAERELADHDATSPAVGFAGEDVRSALAAADCEDA